MWKTLIEMVYLKQSCTEEEWKTIASEEFERYSRNFPHCLGTLDGKHKSYKLLENLDQRILTIKTFSIGLLAICNAHYQLTLVDIGDCRRQSDGSVYNCSHIVYAIENSKLNIPGPAELPNSRKVLQYAFVFGIATTRFQIFRRPIIAKV